MSPSFAALLLALSLPASARRKDKGADADHTNHFREPPPVEIDGVSVSTRDAVARADLLKLKVEIDNDTNDWVMFENDQAMFVLSHGSYPSSAGTLSAAVSRVKPRGKKSPTLQLTGRSDLHVDAFDLQLTGLQRVPTGGAGVDVPPFALPASTNDVKAGNFECGLDKLKKETGETWARFSCTYRGDMVGIIDATKLSFRIESGQSFANENRKAGQDLLLPGEKSKITAIARIEGRIVDMQFANMEIIWDGVFTEVDPQPIDTGTLHYEVDPGETAGNN